MKTLIRFSLNRRFNNRMTIIMNVVVFIVMGLAIHFDHLTGFDNSESIISLDSSVLKYADSFLMLENDLYVYRVSDEGEAVLHYDGQWKLYSHRQLDDRITEQLQKDIVKIISEEYYASADARTRKYIEEFNKLQLTCVYQQGTEGEDNPVWGLLSVIYFIILSYSNLIANEVVYEKATNTLGLIMTSVSEREHFFAKILTAYLSLMIQCGIIITESCIWIMIRYAEDKMKRIISMLMKYVNTENVGISVSVSEILMIMLIVLAGILTVQTIMLILFSGFTNSDDTATYQGPFYLIMVMGYYFLLMRGTASFFNNIIVRILSYIPVLSMIFMPCRIVLGQTNIIEQIMSVVSAVICFTMVIEFGLPVYRKSLLNTKK